MTGTMSIGIWDGMEGRGMENENTRKWIAELEQDGAGKQ